MNDKHIKVCSVCGVTSEESKNMFTKNNKFKKELCVKHYTQLKRNGKVTNSSKPSVEERFKPNIYIYHDDYVEIIMHDKNKTESARTIIDIDDIEEVKKYKLVYCPDGYVQVTENGKSIKLHRVLMNNPKGKCVDHVNRNQLDNRKENLRVCSQAQNLMNRTKSNSKSGRMGVSWAKERNKWWVRIRFNNKNIHLGFFDNLKDAIEAREKAEEKYFGEFAPK